jgi:hypothetical protein
MLTLLVCLSFTNHGIVVMECHPIWPPSTEVSRSFGMCSELGR